MRRVLGGIFRVLRTGASLRDLPERNSLRTTIHNRFKRWAIAGVWVQAFETPAEEYPDSMQVIADSIIRAHQWAAARTKGRGPPLCLATARASEKTSVADLIAARSRRGRIPVQPDRKARRPVDPGLCRQRNLVDRFFNKLKHFGKIGTRQE